MICGSPCIPCVSLTGASTTRIFASGAIACAHSTSKAISVAQPPLAAGIVVVYATLTVPSVILFEAPRDGEYTFTIGAKPSPGPITTGVGIGITFNVPSLTLRMS